ncbi:GNAT family N-acetyltransferase [Pseudovibrio exalbescens]|uniref:GNAT family N-acetyltransferase n=1 Tax=Pseudovibrio exalbescens TaxID=197461 RepID=UPI002366A745|nr:GNAT family N-acetyltransferase [Pseudovibrio exalbescens]MDD7909041.1 GNAT family N-acetyltransferase [Pseudovibrio exalbescens]
MTVCREALAPRLESERLILRGFEPADLDSSYALRNQEVVYQYISGKPSTRQECWYRLLRATGMWAFKGYGSWAIEQKDSGAYLGEIGLFETKSNFSLANGNLPEMGWMLFPEYFGKGFASEAAQTVLAWATDHLKDREIYCLVDPVNTSSVRLAKRLGFVETGRYLNDGIEDLVFRKVL